MFFTVLDSPARAAIMTFVWTSYSARHAAQLIGLPESAVRSCIRAGLVGAPNTVPAQLSFRDLSALRTVKALVDAGVPLLRVRRELARLQASLPAGASLAELTVEARDHHVHVRGTPAPAASGGQLALPFELRSTAPPAAVLPPLGEVRELPRTTDMPVPVAVPPATADQWLARGVTLEERDPVAAIDAYRRSLRLRPDCSEAWINLGRLFAESGDADAARDCFKSALDVDVHDATAYYNLGVLAQDAGKEADAIELYRRALELDAQLAEAHYNLATLFDQNGDSARGDPPHQRVSKADASGDPRPVGQCQGAERGKTSLSHAEVVPAAPIVLLRGKPRRASRGLASHWRLGGP